MKQFIFPLCLLFLALAASSQASDITNQHEREINFSTVKRLMKLIHLLADPKAQSDEKYLKKIAAYIGKSFDLNLEELKRTERSLKFLFGKVKDLFEKIFKKGDKNKAKKGNSQPEDRQGEGEHFRDGSNKSFRSLAG